MRVALISTHRADRAHYAPLRRVLEADSRFTLVDASVVVPNIDVAVVLGDRVEMLQHAMWMVERRVPVLHIHGGEHTIGSLDERYRWAMTMLADKHCVATEEAQWEVDKHILGDAKPGFTDAYRKLSLNTYVTGAPGLDDILPRAPVLFPHEAIIHYNPVIDAEQTRREFAAIVQGLGIHTPKRVFSLEQTLWIKMNGDRGSFGMGEELEPNAYRDELAAAKVIIGNTSAGIIEAPSVGTWFVNVGDRQRRRVRAANVIDVPPHPEAIRTAVLDALQRPRYSGPNPYAHPAGKASEAVRDVLLDMGPAKTRGA